MRTLHNQLLLILRSIAAISHFIAHIIIIIIIIAIVIIIIIIIINNQELHGK